MRKKVILLVLALVALAGAWTSHPVAAAAAPTVYCPQCTYYPDGSSCCVSCWCRNGIAIMCTDNYCPPAGGIE